MNKNSALFLTLTCFSISFVPSTNTLLASSSIISQAVEDEQTNLSPKVIELILHAEMALNRNEPKVALKKYLEALKITKDVKLAQRTVELANDLQDADSAKKAVGIWADNHTEDIQAQLIAITLFMDSNFQKSYTHIRRVFEMAEEESDNLLVATHAKLSMKGTEKLIKAVRKIAEQDIKNEFTYLALGQLYAQQGDAENSQTWAKKALEKNPRLTRGIQLQARLISHTSNDDNALKYLKEQLKFSGQDDELRIFYANALLENQKIVEAKEQFGIVSKSKEFSTEAFSKLGEIYYQEEDYLKAKMSLLEAAKNRDYNFNKNSYMLGLIFERSENIKEAIRWYKNIPPGELHITGHLRAANLFMASEDYSSAIDTLHIAQPTTLFEQKQLITTEISALVADKRLEEALEITSEVLLYLPADTELLYTRALISNKLKDDASAIDDLQKILSLNPLHVQALNSLGYIFIDYPEQHEAAAKLLNNALELEPNNPAVLDSLGWLHYHQGEYDLALNYLQKAASLKNDPEIVAHLGATLWKLGKQNKAKTVWLNGLKESPDSEILISIANQNCGCDIRK